MKSTTCKGQSGQFLEEYHNQSTAELAAEEIKISYGHDLVPTQCRGCGYWHLSPLHLRIQCFQCTDSALFFKDLYPTRNEAQSTADLIRRKKKIQLFPYKCPHSNGWHLTKVVPGRDAKRKK